MWRSGKPARQGVATARPLPTWPFGVWLSASNDWYRSPARQVWTTDNVALANAQMASVVGRKVNEIDTSTAYIARVPPETR